MNFSAKIVVRKNATTAKHEAGFASKTSGVIVAEFGRWFGSQMSYRPFAAAMAAARAHADKLNTENA